MWLRLLLFVGALALVLGTLNVYVYRRAGRAFGLGRGARRGLLALLLVGAAAMVAGRIFGPRLGRDLAEPLAVLGSTIELAVLISAGMLLLVDIPRWVGRLVERAARARRAIPQSDPPSSPEPQADAAAEDPTPDPSLLGRRELVLRTTLGVPLLLGPSTALYGALVGRHDYRLEEVPVRIPGLSPHLEGYTLVQLSDIHFGTFVDEAELEAAANLVRRARPDLIVLTGDHVDHDARYVRDVARLVRKVAPSARDGVVAIPGNHDYYAGIEAVLGAMQRAGARVLRNQGRTVGDRGGAFALLGVDDVWSPRHGGQGPDLDRALSMVPRDLPRILLCHNPEFFPEAASHVQLQLSGHTHGGQVNVGVRFADWVLPYGYVAGRYRRDDSLLYVNRGFGTAGPPARIGAAPEVTRIVLTAG